MNLNDLQTAKVLFETIGEVIGRSTRTTISLENNFYALGGNSLNSIYTVAKLRDKGYFIEITSFITAKNLKETLAYMTKIELSSNAGINPTIDKDIFSAVPLAMEHKNETIQYVNIFFFNAINIFNLFQTNLHPIQYHIDEFYGES